MPASPPSLQEQLLAAALPSLAFDGWTEGTFARAARSVGFTDFDVRRAFPGGVIDAVDYFFARADARMLARLRQDYHLPSMKIRERIATGLMVRFRDQAAEREATRRAIALYALPWHAARGLRALYATLDAIWREAGDTATDYNFYTKRLLLAHVYRSTRSVWLNDHSENLAETEAFLRRRIDEVMQIEKLKAKLRG